MIALEQHEKEAAVRLGAVLGIELCGIFKGASASERVPAMALGAVLGTGLLLGGGAHYLDKATRPDSVSEEEKLRRIGMLREAALRAEEELALQGRLVGGGRHG